MPIYDNDGATNYQIGKAYDNDGTTSRQIGKVYDNDGTTNRLIYTAEENVFQHGVSHYNGVAYVGQGSIEFDGGSLTLSATYSYGYGGGAVNAYTDEPFDLSGVDKLSFSVSTTAGEYIWPNTSIYVGVVKTLPKADGSWLPSGWQNSLAANCMRVINEKEVSVYKASSFVGDYSLDVSDLSGEYYVTFCITNDYGYTATTNATFTNVILS